MQLTILEDKLRRYIQGTTHIAETKQVEAWLSSQHTQPKFIGEKEKENLRQRILFDVQCHTAYPLFYPKKNDTLKKLKPLIIKVSLITLAVVFIYFYAFHRW